jgi:hypothetical protein
VVELYCEVTIGYNPRCATPRWFDTTVVMPRSPARARIVDAAGSADTAAIPLGNPSQPAVPPAVWAALPADVRPLYAHWVRVGLGRIVTLYYRSSASYQIH